MPMNPPKSRVPLVVYRPCFLKAVEVKAVVAVENFEGAVQMKTAQAAGAEPQVLAAGIVCNGINTLLLKPSISSNLLK